MRSHRLSAAYAFPTLACRMQFEQTFGRLSTRGQDWLSTESRVTERLSVSVLRVTAQDFQTQQAAPEAVPDLGHEMPDGRGKDHDGHG